MIPSSNQPRKFDAVLGDSGTDRLANRVIAPMGSMVLGGLEGLQQRWTKGSVEQRMAVLWETPKYGQAGLDLLIQALQDGSRRVQKVAYLLLQERTEVKALEALEAYSPYALFECLYTLKGHTAGITAVAIATQHFLYRPDRETLVSASRDGMIKVWDLDAQEEMFSIDAESFVYAIAIDPDEDIFTIKGENQRIRAWSLKHGLEVMPSPQRTRTIASVTVSDRRYLISGSQNRVKVWDLQVGRELCNLEGHSSLVTAVAIHHASPSNPSQNRPLLVSGSEDRTIRVWGVG